VGAGERHAHASAGEAVDRLAVERLGAIALAEQCSRAGLDAERPVRAAGTGSFGESVEDGGGDFTATAARARLDQL
jgi:hypothetical protein